MKQEMIYEYKCIWCGKKMEVKDGVTFINPCPCLKENRMNVDLRMVEKQIQEVNGDVYLMNKTLELMNENLKELSAKYELLLNRIKCIECKSCPEGIAIKD